MQLLKVKLFSGTDIRQMDWTKYNYYYTDVNALRNPQCSIVDDDF